MRALTTTLMCFIATVSAGCGQTQKEAAVPLSAGVTRTAEADAVSTASLAAIDRVTTFALNAMVVPLLDDDDPPRFAELDQPLRCTEGSEVLVDGQPVIAGLPVPAGAFAIQWDMNMYCPFGPHDVLLDGRVNVLVFRDDERGMDILVQPPLALLMRGAPKVATATTLSKPIHSDESTQKVVVSR